MAKLHSLEEHLRDVQGWYWSTHTQAGPDELRLMFFIAYERWTNNKPLLRDEDK